MGVQKTNFSVYSTLPKFNGDARPVNILTIIEKNKKEEKKEKLAKYLILMALTVTILLFCGLMYL